MAASDWFARVLRTPAVQSLARRVEQGGALCLPDINPSAQAFLAVLLRHLFPSRPLVTVSDTLKSQEGLNQDLQTLLAETLANGRQNALKPLFYPAWESPPHEGQLPHADVISERLETLVALSAPTSHVSPPPSFAPVVVTSVTALLQRTFDRTDLMQQMRTLRRGDRLDPLDLVEWLEDRGYEPESQVTQKGEIALRGGIVDLFPLTSPWPVRLEFFGDELESLRYFEPVAQISREQIEQVIIPPSGEVGLLKRRQVNQPAGIPTPAPVPATLLAFLPPETLFLLCEPLALKEKAGEYASRVPKGDPLFIAWEAFLQEASARHMLLLEVMESVSGHTPSFPSPEVEPTPGAPDAIARTPAGCAATEPPQKIGPEEVSPISPSELILESLDAFRPLTERAPEPQMAETLRREFFVQVHRWLRQGYEVHTFFNSDGEKQRFLELWNDYGLNENSAAGPPERKRPPAPSENSTRRQDSEVPELLGSGLWLHIGGLARGTLFDQARLVLLTDAEIFGRYKVQRPRRLKSAHAQAVRSALDIDFADLEEGDFVVHLQHGIGRYLGLQLLPEAMGRKGSSSPTADSGQECLVIEYAPSDPLQPAPKLYVPITEAHLVSKYVGTGKIKPPLNTLGGTRWAKAKAHAERAVRDVASDLLAIQAARDSLAGHAFAQDTPWQREFESAFVYEETPDQLRAINETKGDMERPKPMDRLICGDVGFGKTEVGIRAAFKAVMDGKQVSVLVPTTVLAQQHFNTFRERMAEFPFRIELLSRFRTRRAQDRVIADLANGAVDIVIGTHRLIQSDVEFKDLGLVIIDEEQRFGVMHKEKFKRLRHLVDVLTLSATPIPRTLYLALSGARDMSTIQTPPHDRLPVQTVVTQYDERLIRDAVLLELNRGGQVFYLHNRVATINTMAAKLAELIPKARLVVGHGQMHADDLEEVMGKFINGEADVLLSTTIIESGLDIPNANTIIIERADRFGLSDLYQLRGRVGRYKHQAYAYLLLPRHARLLTDVRKRMSAIKQYSTLGSGFKIAMRDLEIRGAGNLLGSEQSGHITAVGFDLYCQLLKQSVASLKGEKVKPRIEVAVRLDFLSLQASVALPKPPEPKTPPGAPVDTSLDDFTEPESAPAEIASPQGADSSQAPTTASIPFRYVSDPRLRIEIYRKLAQAGEASALAELRKELRDRFGPVPRELDLLLQVAELKILAAARGIDSLEVREQKVMLSRRGDYIMAGTKFPRLAKKEPSARLKEIKKVLLALAPCA